MNQLWRMGDISTHNLNTVSGGKGAQWYNALPTESPMRHGQIAALAGSRACSVFWDDVPGASRMPVCGRHHQDIGKWAEQYDDDGGGRRRLLRPHGAVGCQMHTWFFNPLTVSACRLLENRWHRCGRRVYDWKQEMMCIHLEFLVRRLDMDGYLDWASEFRMYAHACIVCGLAVVYIQRDGDESGSWNTWMDPTL